ncbi:DUF1073 domain-containing protein [Candidatus Pacearchaeota archaeon]|nr:DUF1073 domain-containing protein [Candidatus Pacearchaeota archaeon]
MAKHTNSKGFSPVANESKPVGNFTELVRFQEIVDNVLMQRKQFFDQYFDSRRSLEDECGYPKLGSFTPQQYKHLYDSDPVGCRVVELMPLESQQVTPTIFEDEDTETTTEFEDAWDEIGKSLRGKSWFQDEAGNPFWDYVLRGDVLSGIGHFGVLLLGINDGKELFEPADGVEQSITGNAQAPAKKGTKLLYMRAFDESQVSVVRWDTDKTSVRYGQPVMYSVTLWNTDQPVTSGSTPPSGSFDVHWTRCIHISDGLGSSDVVGVPRIRPVLHPVLDIRKVAGGSAEMYWKGAFPGLSLETHPQLGGNVKVSKATLRSQMEQYFNGLQRYLGLMGMSAKTLSPTVVDPTPQVEIQIKRICIKIGCPVRVFLGSERGELASSQDDSAWNDRLKQRQNGHVTPKIIIPTIDRLIMMGVLPEPNGYSVIWPDLESLSDMEQADIAAKRTAALSQYVQSGAEAVISPADFFTRIIGLGLDEAKSILEAVDKRIKDEDSGGSPLLSMASGITGLVELFKLYAAGSMSRDTLKQAIMMFFKVDEAKAEAIISKEELKAAAPPVPGQVPNGKTPGGKPPFGKSSAVAAPANDGEDEDNPDTEGQDATTNQSLTGNKTADGWVTIGGQHVLIKGGKPVNPPGWSNMAKSESPKPESAKSTSDRSAVAKSASDKPDSRAKPSTSYKNGDEAERDLAPSKSQWAETSDDYFANKAVKAYAGTSDSFLINNCLRTNCKEKSLKAKADALAEVLGKTSFPKDVTTHRAVNAKTPQEREAILNQFTSNVGKTVVDNAFISTTANKKYAATWGKNSKVEPIQVEVRVPKGAKAAYLPKDIVGKQEWEVLIQRGSKYKVSSVSNGKVVLEYLG